MVNPVPDDYSPSDTTQSQSEVSPKSASSTGSGGGSGASVAGQAERDEDFTKDNSASPVDLECTIQEERVIKILDEAHYKIKVAICLPRLIREGTLQGELTKQSYDEVMVIYEQYDSQLFSNSLLNMSAVEDIKAGDTSMQNRLSPEQGHLISVLNSCPNLRSIVDEMIFQMKMDYNMSSSGSITAPSLIQYLVIFERFRELVIRQLKWTAVEIWQAKIHTRKLEISNEKLIVKNAELSTLLIKEKEDFEKTMEIKTQIIANLGHDLQTKNFEAATKLHKSILDSERQMVLMKRAHIVTDDLLKEEDEHTRESYDNTMKNHMRDEKSLRARRFKVETQLLSWIQKYDNDMSENTVEMNEFTEKYDQEQARVEILEERLAEQDIKFAKLMGEREAEYAEEMTNKMNQFRREHAARILQVCWREVLANRKEKKKLKKALKKIKEAAAKAETLALKQFKKEQKIKAIQAKKAKEEAKREKEEAKKNKA